MSDYKIHIENETGIGRDTRVFLVNLETKERYLIPNITEVMFDPIEVDGFISLTLRIRANSFSMGVIPSEKEIAKLVADRLINR